MKNFVRVTWLVVALAVLLSTSAFGDSGADTFKSKCAGCHGASGGADAAMGKSMKLKDLGSADVQSKSDAQLTEIITKGQKPMPGYEGKLTGDQISDVVKYIRTFKK
ncbi:MAG TPA: cytochrome c [Terriglobales bacterium]|nr:cytochrome c [Terriglobales bacterium]